MSISNTNIINLSTFRFPIGSKAWHKNFRICYIIGSSGSSRQIKTAAQNQIGMHWVTASVHLRELEELWIPSIF